MDVIDLLWKLFSVFTHLEFKSLLISTIKLPTTDSACLRKSCKWPTISVVLSVCSHTVFFLHPTGDIFPYRDWTQTSQTNNTHIVAFCQYMQSSWHCKMAVTLRKMSRNTKSELNSQVYQWACTIPVFEKDVDLHSLHWNHTLHTTLHKQRYSVDIRQMF